MGEYNFNDDRSTAKFEIKIDQVAMYGFFEHNTLGDERGGGLWFQKTNYVDRDGNFLLELTDYDGVAVLPKDVAQALIDGGYLVEDAFL